MHYIETFFKFKERKTTLKTEVIAGVTTFLSVLYILFVNPQMLAATGMDIKAVFVATALVTIIGTLLMGLYANYPIVQAPGMGINAFFTYTVVGLMGYSWQEALLAVFVSGLFFMAIALSGLRELIIEAIPEALKYAVSAGVGFFIAFLGLKNAGIIVANPSTFVGLGDLHDPQVLLAFFGLAVTLILVARNYNGGIFIGILVTAILGIFLGMIKAPTQIVSTIPDLSPTFGQLFKNIYWGHILDGQFLVVVFSMLFLQFFDTTGTLLGIATKANLLDKNGKLVDSDRVLLANATATTAAGVVGSSPVTNYVESVVGVAAGGRTGFVAIVVAVLFFFSLFFSPLLGVVSNAVTAPASITVGAFMVSNIQHIKFKDFAESTGVFFTIIFMVLASSIAEGIAFGFLAYTILKFASGKKNELHPMMYVLSALFIMYFVFK
jgi:adenine/guanine/hypoxanthine permease